MRCLTGEGLKLKFRSNHEYTIHSYGCMSTNVNTAKKIVFPPNTNVYFAGLSLISGQLSSKNRIEQRKLSINLNDLAHSITRDSDVTSILNLPNKVNAGSSHNYSVEVTVLVV